MKKEQLRYVVAAITMILVIAMLLLPFMDDFSCLKLSSALNEIDEVANVFGTNIGLLGKAQIIFWVMIVLCVVTLIVCFLPQISTRIYGTVGLVANASVLFLACLFYWYGANASYNFGFYIVVVLSVAGAVLAGSLIEFGNSMKQYGMVIMLIVVYVFFAVLTRGKNMSPMNINNLIMQNGYVVILAVGMLLCVLTGNVDLGVGSVVAACGAVAGSLLMDFGVSAPVAMLGALAVGAAFGVFVGFFVSKLEIPPFIVTLATMLMGRGLCYVILKAQTKGPLPASYNWIGTGFLPTIRIFSDIETFNKGKGVDLICLIIASVIAVLIIAAEIRSILTAKKHNLPTIPLWLVIAKDAVILFIVGFFFWKLGNYNGIPVVLILMAALVGIYHFITTKTVAGRQVYAMGGNAKAARLSGINTKKVFFWVYANMGLLAAVAGIVLSARNQSATPKAGDGFEMDAIASCYIGGAATSGGVGTIIGAVVGAFIMGILNNGMSLAGYDTNVQKIVKGCVLLGAVTFDLLSKRKKR